MPMPSNREQASKGTTQKVNAKLKRGVKAEGSKYPAVPSCSDGKFEGTVGGKTKLKSF